MHLVVVGQPAWQLLDDGLGIQPGPYADVVALERTDERLGHAVRLRAADRGRAWDQPDAAGEGTSIARDIAATAQSQTEDAANLASLSRI